MISKHVTKAGKVRWRVLEHGSPGADGSRPHRAATCDTRREAVEASRRFREELSGVTSGAALTVEAYLARWLDRRWREVAGTTWDRNRRAAGLAAAALGRRKLARLSPDDLRGWVGALERDFESSTARSVFGVLRKALSDAVRDGLLARSPAENVKAPAAGGRYRLPPDSDFAASMERARGRRWEIALRILEATGARAGEVCGLRWSRVDIEGLTITVDSVIEVREGGLPALRGHTKNRRVRTIAIPAALGDDLRLWRAALRREQVARGVRDSSGLVYPTKAGAALRPSRLAAILRAGGAVHPHGWRHRHASMLMSAGLSPAAVAERLGDAVATVMAFYAHSMPADDRRAAELVAAARLGS